MLRYARDKTGTAQRADMLDEQPACHLRPVGMFFLAAKFSLVLFPRVRRKCCLSPFRWFTTGAVRHASPHVHTHIYYSEDGVPTENDNWYLLFSNRYVETKAVRLACMNDVVNDAPDWFVVFFDGPRLPRQRPPKTPRFKRLFNFQPRRLQHVLSSYTLATRRQCEKLTRHDIGFQSRLAPHRWSINLQAPFFNDCYACILESKNAVGQRWQDVTKLQDAS